MEEDEFKAMNSRKRLSPSAVLTTHVWSVVRQNKQAGRKNAGVFMVYIKGILSDFILFK